MLKEDESSTYIENDVFFIEFVKMPTSVARKFDDTINFFGKGRARSEFVYKSEQINLGKIFYILFYDDYIEKKLKRRVSSQGQGIQICG